MTQAAAPKVSVFNKLAYGFGSVAFGVKNNGFDYYFLLFYSQVMGVDAALVGNALLLALMFDALSDPLIGYFSDNFHSRWGRRHPFMYFAAVPVAISYYFLWNPPAGMVGNELFPFIVVMSIFIRTLITLYEIPSSALVAEMTTDYDERTSMLSYRYFFGWSGGTLMSFFALTFLLVPTAAISNGMFNIEGYGQMGLVAASVMFFAIMISALGTHGFIPYLNAPPPKERMTLKRIYSDLWATLANRSFLALFLAALFGAIATGLAAGLAFYLNTFFWEFTSAQQGIIAISVVLSAVIGFVVAPFVSRTMGKKRGTIVVGMLAFSVSPMPVVLRLFDVMPANGDALLFPLILGVTIIDVGLIITFQTLMASMIADLVEASEVKTKRRSEGVFFSAISFTRKMVQGVGVVVATFILTLAEIQPGATPDEVSADSLFKLGAYYAPTIFFVWMIMIGFITLYRIDRQTHVKNLQDLGRA
ncbi:MAG: MFS transporter [Pseudomonadaceae bacterium]|nr:MFS transporter [Pseudomonadaceae bacterium]